MGLAVAVGMTVASAGVGEGLEGELATEVGARVGEAGGLPQPEMSTTMANRAAARDATG